MAASIPRTPPPPWIHYHAQLGPKPCAPFVWMSIGGDVRRDKVEKGGQISAAVEVHKDTFRTRVVTKSSS
ncbi:hypothetical protein TRIUR3_28211 [Triticum urartu]|uniref:Uncharacterized protein n=1 Tax=Triticum urartu TaxID=4572 RepID=M7ZR41_TRIUA|nr:hypothetical protein TRIUR3_28211 [Triticum urartu]